jgi:hypothetical protein
MINGGREIGFFGGNKAQNRLWHYVSCGAGPQFIDTNSNYELISQKRYEIAVPHTINLCHPLSERQTFPRLVINYPNRTQLIVNLWKKQ